MMALSVLRARRRRRSRSGSVDGLDAVRAGEPVLAEALDGDVDTDVGAGTGEGVAFGLVGLLLEGGDPRLEGEELAAVVGLHGDELEVHLVRREVAGDPGLEDRRVGAADELLLDRDERVVGHGPVEAAGEAALVPPVEDPVEGHSVLEGADGEGGGEDAGHHERGGGG